jgi:sugar lactone lactonase YvrE
MRNLTALAFLFSLAPIAQAQDMPLAQILIEGEGWKKTTGQPPSPAFAFKSEETSSGNRQEYAIGNRKFTCIDTPESSKETKYQKHGLPTAGFVSRDGGTVFIGHDTGYIWAYPAKADGTLLPGQPYCPVRTQMDRRKADPTTSSSLVSSMTGDKDGRIYVATPLGVQVFDPTGRLCGVLTPAAPGKPEHLSFEGDKLTMWIGDTKYERKLNTTGVKP